MTTTIRLDNKKVRQVTIFIPWDLYLKYEAACDRENLNRATREEPMLSLQQHLQATLVPALQVIVDKIPHEEAP